MCSGFLPTIRCELKKETIHFLSEKKTSNENPCIVSEQSKETETHWNQVMSAGALEGNHIRQESSYALHKQISHPPEKTDGGHR